MTTETDITITGVGFADYSARGITCSLEPIEASGQLRRTINGTMLDLSNPAFQKYKMTLSATDQEFPKLGHVWFGKEVYVTSVITLQTGGGTATTGATAIGFTGMITNWTVERDEWAYDASWSIEIEQI